jgi:DNA-3-methyladenine glycosylase
LPRSFYLRDPRTVARELLGKVLVRKQARGRGLNLCAGRIVEAEAYLGENDDAAHATSGLTARNQVLFGPAGHAYVYFTYGMHYCMNVSCLPAGQAGCVLLRALEPLAGIAAMARRRGTSKMQGLARGPARLCQALAITRARDNGKDLTSAQSDLWIGDDGCRPKAIVTTKRIGIRKSAELPLRYYIRWNDFVSGSE